MFQVVLHSPTIDSPVAGWSLLDALGHQVPVFLYVHEDHLEPQLSPAIVAYCSSLVQPHPLLDSGRRPEESAVEHELELSVLCHLQHLVEHLRHIFLLTHQQVAEGIHLHPVVAEEERLNGTSGCSIAEQDQLRAVLLAGRHVEVAEERVAQLAALIQLLFIVTYCNRFAAVMTVSMGLTGFALESFPLLDALLTIDGGLLDLHVSYFDI
jgi:hypothetical protein